MKPHLDLRSYRAEIDSHSHDHHQLVLPLNGSLEIEIGGRGGRVESRSAAVIHSGETHCFRADGRNRFIVADLPSETASEFDNLPPFLPLTRDALDYSAFLGRMLSRRGMDDAVQHAGCDLLLNLLIERRGSTDTELDRRVLRARDYIDRHFAEPIRLSTLGGLAHLSRRQLNALFQRQLGCTPSDYLIQRRMEHARALLIGSDDSIQRVAEQCGYSNLAAFSDRFRRHFHCAPSRYRSSKTH